jgi:cytochrome c-type biogenesis protein CcmH/NrfG
MREGFPPDGGSEPSTADIHYWLGDTLMGQGEYAAAAASYEQALKLRPDHAETLHNLGVALACQGQLDAAMLQYEHALRIKPDLAEGHFNQGNTFREKGQLGPAVECYETVLRLRPDFAEAHNNLGLILHRRGQVEEALAHYEQAIGLQPDLANAHFSRAQAWLMLGDFQRGWPEYEWRWKLPGVGGPPAGDRLWDGSAPAGRTILLWAEQGLGDTLQFIRYAPLVQRMGGRVLVECQESLLPLLGPCAGIDGLLAQGADRPPFDLHAPLLSVPGLLGTTVDRVPAEVPYLFADPALVEHWRRVLAEIPGFKVGIAWQVNPNHPDARHCSIPLEQFVGLARLPGVGLINLQKGSDSGRSAPGAPGFPLIELGSGLDQASGAFMDTAAVMQSLDLVITPDTAIAHLAGGLGVPVWVALAMPRDWRFLQDREDSPWYPTMRLFRQRPCGDWAGVFGRMAGALDAILGAASHPGAKDRVVGVAAERACLRTGAGGRNSGGTNHHQGRPADPELGLSHADACRPRH